MCHLCQEIDSQETFWSQELGYIQSVRPSKPGKSFNHDKRCFESYCEMQAKGARRDGFYGIADLIFNHCYKGEQK